MYSMCTDFALISFQNDKNSIELKFSGSLELKEETRLSVEPDQCETFSERNYLIDYRIDCCTDFKKIHTQNSTIILSMLTFPIIQKINAIEPSYNDCNDYIDSGYVDKRVQQHHIEDYKAPTSSLRIPFL